MPLGIEAARIDPSPAGAYHAATAAPRPRPHAVRNACNRARCVEARPRVPAPAHPAPAQREASAGAAPNARAASPMPARPRPSPRPGHASAPARGAR
ncbi:hypothetical protein G6F62_015330 [Rhizopus arrhizus]|nr:hypothetical protein G6F62_015330 [Rhizopus arrhizus]